MIRPAVGIFAAWVSSFALAGENINQQALSVAQIVEKNVAARGGLDAWRKIQTMIWVGHIESAHAPSPNLPFVLEMKRPNMTRFDIKVQNQTATRIYDGNHGWKLHPSHSGKPELQPYTKDEVSFAEDGQGIDGPLIDFQAKGITVALDGLDEIEGHKSYRLKIKLPSGASHHLWIDAKTFLDIKSDRESRNTFGQSGTVSVFYRNYKTIDGLQLPLLVESGTETAKETDKMVIDKIVLNPPLENLVFAKPRVPGRNNVVSVGVVPPATRQANRPLPTLPPGFSRLDPRYAPSLREGP